ncbi:HIT family protein [Streptococcus sp. NLN76]|uniref:HIT family protein n=1 Tax=Streptococcus sp. NLN76 TaxID=2822800 RepID=UPI0018A98D2A|nr:HIT family protein [Streptococcus sp. NLN76]MBF8969525.1 HIT family protein [Streptococcus sp. NLN76]
MTCVFCKGIKEENILFQSKYFKMVWDINPIQSGHLLVISKEHYESLEQLPERIRYELVDLQAYLTKVFREKTEVDGVSLVYNDGVMDPGTHFHFHLIPRYRMDGFWDPIDVERVEMDVTHLLEAMKKWRINQCH